MASFTKNKNIQLKELFKPGEFVFQTSYFGICSAYGRNVYAAKDAILQDLKEQYVDLDFRGRTSYWRLEKIEHKTK